MKEQCSKPSIFLKIIISLVLLIIFCDTQTFAQGVGKVRGKVVEIGSSVPISDVTILLEGSNRTSVTDRDGNFEINVDKSGNLIFRIIGFIEKRVFVNVGESTLVEMSKSNEDIDEVVVVGYGQQKKLSVTGAISTVGTKELKQSTQANFSAALAGRLPGLTTFQTSGQPGNDAVNLYLRGLGTVNDASPLILIDGIPRNNISKIDPNEVENVTVLKDASATAAFGVRGANGVVLITTRRGVAGKSELSMSGDQSFQQYISIPPRINSWEFAELRNQAYLNTNPTATEDQMPFTQYMIDKYRSGEDPVFYPNRDVFHDFFRDWAPQTRLNANFNGGGDKFTYFLNAGYIGQGGNFKTEPKSKLGYDPSYKMNRYNFRGNIDYNIAKNLKASLNIGTYLERMNSPQTIDVYGNNLSLMLQNMMGYIIGTPPIEVGPLTQEGYGVPAGEVVVHTGQSRNTYGEINRRGYRQETSNNLNSSFNIDWGLDFITKGLSAKALIAFDSHASTVIQGVRGLDYYGFKVARSTDEENLYSVIIGNSDPSIRLYKTMGTRYYLNFQGALNYARNFDQHSVTGMALFQRDNWDNFGADLPYNIIGLVGRATYAYDNRYLAEFNIGYNGSEQFAPANRFGIFPAYSVGWVASNEDFLKDNELISLLKLRGSHGKTGNDKMGGSRFLYQSFLNLTGGAFSTLGRGQSVVQGRMGNPAIQWEIARKTNIGLDVELMKSLSLTVDVFKENRDKILLSRKTIPQLQGVAISDIPRVNIGEVNNRGFEAELTYKKALEKDWSFLIRGHYAYNKNTVINYDEVQFGADYAHRYRITGYSIGQPFGYKIDYSNGNGYINTTEELANMPDYDIGGNPRLGDFKYVDINGDGIINEKDLVPIGNPTVPRVTYGLSGSINYKDLDLSFLFTGVGKSSRFSSDWGVWEFGMVGAYTDWHKQAWTAERFEKGEEILYPALGIAPGVSQKHNDFFIFDRSFLRLKTIELGYQVPSNIFKSGAVKRIRVYVNANNLFTIHKYPVSTVDPEQNDTLVYPLTRMFNFGLSVSF